MRQSPAERSREVRAGRWGVAGPAVAGLAFLAGVLVARLPDPREATAAGGLPDFADVVARAEPAVAHVTTVLAGARAPGSRDDAVGAGFVFSPDGLLVTSRHVIQGASEVRVSLPGLPPVAAQVVGSDEATDVAVLRIPSAGLPTLRVGDPHALRPGQWLLAAGSPYHLPRSWSLGIVSGLHRSQIGVSLKGYEDFIQTDASANIGNSGGPVFDGSGAVVGMMTAILSRTGVNQGISLAVPIDVVLETARRLSGGQPTARPSLGIVVREVGTGGWGLGLEVTRFQPGSPAQAAGLRVGDVIVAVDGQRTQRTADLQRIVWARPAGGTVRVEFHRPGAPGTTPVFLDVPLR